MTKDFSITMPIILNPVILKVNYYDLLIYVFCFSRDEDLNLAVISQSKSDSETSEIISIIFLGV